MPQAVNAWGGDGDADPAAAPPPPTSLDDQLLTLAPGSPDPGSRPSTSGGDGVSRSGSENPGSRPTTAPMQEKRPATPTRPATAELAPQPPSGEAPRGAPPRPPPQTGWMGDEVEGTLPAVPPRDGGAAVALPPAAAEVVSIAPRPSSSGLAVVTDVPDAESGGVGGSSGERPLSAPHRPPLAASAAAAATAGNAAPESGSAVGVPAGEEPGLDDRPGTAGLAAMLLDADPPPAEEDNDALGMLVVSQQLLATSPLPLPLSFA